LAGYASGTYFLYTKEMPMGYKLKTKSGAKKRFKINKNGVVKCGQANKRHGMIKRTPKQIRQSRGTVVLAECDVLSVRRMMPYA
jgi:large subunit ribosomal protein L35